MNRWYRLDVEKAICVFCSTGQMVNGSVVPFESFEDATFTEDGSERNFYIRLFLKAMIYRLQ